MPLNSSCVISCLNLDAFSEKSIRTIGNFEAVGTCSKMVMEYAQGRMKNWLREYCNMILVVKTTWDGA
jgi:hypothetical protein